MSVCRGGAQKHGDWNNQVGLRHCSQLYRLLVWGLDARSRLSRPNTPEAQASIPKTEEPSVKCPKNGSSLPSGGSRGL